MSNRKPVIGIAGGIGSGKTLVAKQLESFGAVIVDADLIAKQMLDHEEVREKLIEWWGDSVVGEEGKIDCQAVAKVIFNDPKQRRRLEHLVHPLVAVERDRVIAQVQCIDEVVAVVVDAPLLIEAGWMDVCDHLIFIHAERENRLARLIKTRHWDEVEFKRREKCQLPLDKKLEMADDIVHNNSSEQNCLEQVKSILARILHDR